MFFVFLLFLLLLLLFITGWGAFSRESIRPGEFVVEYVGEFLSSTEAERRGRQYDKRKLSYIFTVNGEDDCLDATKKANKSRFINSDRDNASCECRVMSVRCDPHVGLYARQTIQPNDELTIWYGEKFLG